MKIALIHYAAAPVVGGVERVLAEHARWFVQQGHEVVTVCQRGGEGDAVVRLPLEADSRRQLAALRVVLPSVDVAMVHNVMTMPFHLGLTEALLQVAREFDQIRWVSWIHDVAACNPDLAPVPEILRQVPPGFECVTVSALRQRQWREVSGVESEIVPNGVDPARVLGLSPEVAALADRFHLLDGRLLLLHPTRLLRRKNVEMSLGIVAALRKQGQPATLLVTGAEDPHNPASAVYAAWLRAEQFRLGADALFLGEHLAVDEGALASLYRLADALLFPSRQEGFGLPVLEAALHRLPIFCSEIEPLAALAGPTTTLFSAEADAGVVAASVREVLGRDAAFLHRRQTLIRYAWEAIGVRNLSDFLKKSSRFVN